MSFGLIDSHCHLTDPRFDEDREAAIERARQAGLTHIVAVGGGGPVEASEAAAVLARTHGFIRATAGIHPHDAKTWTEEIAGRVDSLLALDEVTAVGETGLDYHYDYSPRDVQRRVFAAHVALAKRHDKPLVVHCRNAESDLRELLAAEAPGGLRGVMHCYTGGYDDACRLIDYGFLISFSGILTFKTAEDLRDTARRLPLDRLMVETDSPYLTPEPVRGRRNEPAFVRHTAETLARVKRIDLEAVVEATGANAGATFFAGG